MPQRPLDYAVPKNSPGRPRVRLTWRGWLTIAVMLVCVAWGIAVGFSMYIAHVMR
jgi:hypothetical protein